MKLLRVLGLVAVLGLAVHAARRPVCWRCLRPAEQLVYLIRHDPH